MARDRMSTRGRLGWHGYARILRALQQRPMTIAELRIECGLGGTGAAEIMRRMKAVGLVHIAGWRQASPGTKGRLPAIWGAGDAEDCPYPGAKRPVLPERHRSIRSELLAFATILRACESPATVAEIAEQTGCDKGTVTALMRYCRSIGLVYVAGWLPWKLGGGTPTRLYALGNRRDAPRPRAVASETRSAKRYADAQRRIEMAHLLHITAGALPHAVA